MNTLILTPAYGRDYTSAKAVKADWESDKDFRINDMSSPDDGRLINKQDCPAGMELHIRFKRMMSICVIKT